jgi:hypothetical protein
VPLPQGLKAVPSDVRLRVLAVSDRDGDDPADSDRLRLLSPVVDRLEEDQCVLQMS